jgi:hypothetical protein
MSAPDHREPAAEVGKDDPQTRREEVELDLMDAEASDAGEHIGGVAEEVDTDQS